jgi:UDP-N-acetylglucosamine 2-epimerase (non-hydrolysing)
VVNSKVLVVFGTRPEAIKLAPVVRELRARPGYEVVVCSTGQHREMVKPVCSLFDIHCDYDLDIMRPGQELTYVAAAVIDRLAEVIAKEKPHLTVVQGDTTTAFAAALSSFYCKVPVAHVEAGLRTWNMQSPWPEEANRVLVGKLAALHFPPTQPAYDALIKENVPAADIVLTGNTVVDAALQTAAAFDAGRGATLDERFSFLNPEKPLVLFTMHRRESFGEPMTRVFEALRRFCATHDVEVLFPVHPNPNVRGKAHEILGAQPNVKLVDPLDYEEIVYALRRCRFLITDSGGLVEEAPTFNKPALVLRDTTERPESVDAGCAILCGTDPAKLTRLAEDLLRDGELFKSMSSRPNPFGDGQAARRIADAMNKWRGQLSEAA